MNLLDILSGSASREYAQQMDSYNRLEERRNQSLFDQMTEDRRQKRVIAAAGKPGEYHDLPDDIAGPVGQGRGTGLFGTPEDELLSQILLADINSSAYAPALTNRMSRQGRYDQAMDMQGSKNEAAMGMAEWKNANPPPPTEGDTYDFRDKDQTVTKVWDADLKRFVEAGRGDTFSKSGGGAGGRNASFKDEQDMYKTFVGLPEVKNYKLIQKQAGRIDAAKSALADFRAGGDTKSLVAVDQSLITIFNKSMDESSVVRESEYARTPSDQSLVNRLKGGLAKRISEGGAGLTDADRNSLMDMIDRFRAVSESLYLDTAEYTRDRATSYGFNPSRIVRPEDYEPGQILEGPGRVAEIEAGTVLPDLPPGFEMQPDGVTAINRDTGQTARLR